MNERPPAIGVVGSGLAGLACADRLSGRAEVVVFERLPVAGGEHWEQGRIAALVKSCRKAGVRFRVATQAVRWDGERALAIGPEGGGFPFACLVIATGHRCHTLAELGVAGPRCGGVVSATVALHLLRHGVCLGRCPVVVGDSQASFRLAEGLLKRGARSVTLLAPGHLVAPPPDERICVLSDVRLRSLKGAERIQAVEIITPNAEHRDISCDALVLAHGRVPYRNVDGALSGGSGVVYAQSAVEQPDGEQGLGAGHAASELALAIVASRRNGRDPKSNAGGTS